VRDEIFLLMKMPFSSDQYNNRIEAWVKMIRQEIIRGAQGRHDVKHRPDSPSSGPSVPKIRHKLFKQYDIVSRITITYPRELVWTMAGAGKGRGGLKGSRWVDKYGARKSTDPRSLGKAGTGGRIAKPFIQESLDSEIGIDELANIVAEEAGSIMTGEIVLSFNKTKAVKFR
jgi:hypothetical protein